MPSNSNPDRGSFQLRSPGVETLQAQNVPHVPASQMSGVGDNMTRLSQALGQFSKNLSKFSHNTAKTRNDALKEEMVRVRDTGTASPEVRQQAYRASGKDAIADTWLDNAKYDREFPQREATEIQNLKDLEGNKWMREDPGANEDEKGNPIPGAVPITDQDHLDWLHNQNRVAHGQLGGAKQTLLLAKQVKFNQHAYERRVQAMHKYRDDEMDSKADTVLRSETNNNLLAVHNASGGDPTKAVRLLQANLKRQAMEMNAPSAQKMRYINQSMLDGLTEASTRSVADAIATKNILMGSPSDGVPSFVEHKTYQGQAIRIMKEADNTIAAAEAGTRFNTVVETSIKNMQAGATYATLNNKEIKVRGGTKDFKYTPKEIQTEIEKRLEVGALKNGAVSRDITPEAATELLANSFSATGLASPTLTRMMKDATIAPDMGEAQLGTLRNAMLAYASVNKHDPKNIDAYIKPDQRKVFEKLKLLTQAEDENGLRKYDMKDAVKRLYDQSQNGGTKMLSNFNTQLFAFTKKHKHDLGAEDLKDIKDEFELLHGTSTGLTDREVTRHLEELATEKMKRIPKVNGSAIQLPRDVGSVQRYVATLEQSVSLLAERHGLDQSKVKLIRTEGGYRIVDKATGYTLRDKKGEYGAIEISDDLIKNVDARMAEIEAQKKSNRAQRAIAGSNSAWRSRMEPVTDGNVMSLEEQHRKLNDERTRRRFPVSQ